MANTGPAFAPRKLLHVFPTFEVGGAQVRFAQIVNALGGEFAHRVVPLNRATGTEKRLNSDIDCEIVDPPVEARSLSQRLPAYRRLIHALKPDLVLTYNWGAIEWVLANQLSPFPHLHMEDGFSVQEANKQFARRIWTRRLAFIRKTHLLVPSRTLLEIATAVWRVPKSRLHFVPNGIDTKRFKRTPDAGLIQRLSLPEDRIVVGTVAALRREKNIARLIRSFHAASTKAPVHLLIVGDGPERQDLESQVEALNLREKVTFAGHVSDPAILLGALDIFAISSDTEQMPYSVLEAMAAGLPIAGIEAGDIANLVDPANREFIVPRTDEHLADAICNLAMNRETRDLLGGCNSLRADKEYNENLMIRTHRNLWLELSFKK